MRIYTEIVYIWDDNKEELVEESSKSFDYEGELTLCHRKTESLWGRSVVIPHNHELADALGIGNSGNNPWQTTIDTASDTAKDWEKYVKWLMDDAAAAGGNVVDTATSVVEGASSTITSAVNTALADPITEAWGNLATSGTDLWDKMDWRGVRGGDFWKGTPLQDMSKSWSHKPDMFMSHLENPGNPWDWNTSFQSRWMAGKDMLREWDLFGNAEFKEYTDRIYTDFKAFTDNATAAAEAAAAAAAAATETVVETGTQVGETVVETGTQVGETVVDTGSQVGQTVVDTGSQVGQAVVDTGSDIGQAVVDTGTQVGEVVADTGGSSIINSGIKATVDLVSDPIGTTTDAINEGSSIITGGINTTVQATTDALGEVEDTLNIDDTIGTMVDTAGNVGQTVIDTASQVGSVVSGGIETGVQNVEGGISDNSAVLSGIENDINTGVSNAVGQAEVLIDKNTDSLSSAINTINYNVDQANSLISNTQAIVNDVTAGVNQHILDPLLNIGNQNSLITNPTGWYENAFHDWTIDSINDLPGGGGDFDRGVIEDYSTIVGGILGGALGDFTDKTGGAMQDTLNDMGILTNAQDRVDDDATTADSLLLSSRRNRGASSIYGDPFGNQSEVRRLIDKKKTFQSMAPSLINRASPAVYG
jgi:hypothetical protein